MLGKESRSPALRGGGRSKAEQQQEENGYRYREGLPSDGVLGSHGENMGAKDSLLLLGNILVGD